MALRCSCSYTSRVHVCISSADSAGTDERMRVRPRGREETEKASSSLKQEYPRARRRATFLLFRPSIVLNRRPSISPPPLRAPRSPAAAAAKKKPPQPPPQPPRGAPRADAFHTREREREREGGGHVISLECFRTAVKGFALRFAVSTDLYGFEIERPASRRPPRLRSRNLGHPSSFSISA